MRTVEGDSLRGNTLGVASARRVSVYLPPSYDESPAHSYPSLYLLHGIYDSDRTWTEAWPGSPAGYATLQGLMDRGIHDGTVAEMIVVIPDSEKTCHYTNSPLKGRWEDFLRGDLVSFVDREYRTLRDSAARGIAGHSMGGHGAIKLGMKYPETFGAVYGLSPSLLAWAEDVSPANPAFRELEHFDSASELDGAHFYLKALVGIGRCFSPNPALGPFLTDLPFAADDGVVTKAQPGHERWQRQLPLFMLDAHADDLRQLRGLRFDAGDDDEYGHIPVAARAFSEALQARGIAHVYDEYDGDHRNRLWGRDGRLFVQLLPFFSETLAAARVIEH